MKTNDNKTTNENTKVNKKKKKRRPLITVGIIVALIGVLFGFKFYDMTRQGINIFTGELTGDLAEQVEANSSAPDVELNYDEMFSESDLEQVPDMEQAVELNLEDGKDIVIDNEGIYAINGEYSDTMIVIEADDKEKVQLVLDGVSIVNENKPAVYVKSGDKVYITTTDSNNDISVTGKYLADGDTMLDAAIYSMTDVVLNGLGALDVNSEEGNGISGKDDLKITGGTYNVSAKYDGLEANDSIRIYDGDISIDSDKDAMHSENEEDESLGYVYIQNGLINITAGDDAIRGNSAVVIDGGTINVDMCTEGFEASQIIINDGEVTMYSINDGVNAAFKTSYRAMVEVNGGVINIALADGDTDGVDSNGDFTMNGGEIYVDGGMAAFDIDGNIAYNAGNVVVNGVAQTEIVTQQIGIGMMFNRNK